VASSLTRLKVFIASPDGLAKERKAFREEVCQYNELEAIPRGVLFDPVGWENTPGGVGRPQSLINEDLESSDYFVLVMHDRWGSSPGGCAGSTFTSGTEEEYKLALRCQKAVDQPMRQLLVVFKAANDRQLSDPGDELKKVLEFKKQIEKDKSLLYRTFDSTQNFRRILREHLATCPLCQHDVRRS
jgi:Domain of unknown function (DUF4062)